MNHGLQSANPQHFDHSGLINDLLSSGPGKLLELGLDLAAVVVALFTGIFLLRVSLQQARSARDSKEIERQRLLHELEQSYGHLSATPSVSIQRRLRFDPGTQHNFVVALTRSFPWDAPREVPTYMWSNGDRLLVFTADSCLLSSSTLHEFLYWFRRVSRAKKSDLLNPGDLHDLWRQTLPFATDQRYSFLHHYFGGHSETSGGEDIEAITSVLLATISFCIENGHRTPLNYLKGRLDPMLIQHAPPELVTALKEFSRSA